MNNYIQPVTAQETNARDIALSQLLVAAEGDMQLVIERYNYSRPEDDKINKVDVMQSFLNVAASSEDIQNAIKASMLLSFLEILRVTKDNLITALPEFEGPALLRAFRDVTEAIVKILPQTQPTIVNNLTNNVLQNFAPDEARNRVLDRLNTIKKISDRYPTAPGDVIDNDNDDTDD